MHRLALQQPSRRLMQPSSSHTAVACGAMRTVAAMVRLAPADRRHSSAAATAAATASAAAAVSAALGPSSLAAAVPAALRALTLAAHRQQHSPASSPFPAAAAPLRASISPRESRRAVAIAARHAAAAAIASDTTASSDDASSTTKSTSDNTSTTATPPPATPSSTSTGESESFGGPRLHPGVHTRDLVRQTSKQS